MPDMLAHYDVAEAARTRLAPGPLAHLLAGAADAYAVGSQGPDFLFYTHVLPRRRELAGLAFQVHQHHMREAFTAMLSQAAAAPAAERETLFAFACGYAAHLCLDACAHPWILYWTGDISGGVDSPAESEAMRRHGILEASLDVALAATRRPAGFSWRRSRRLLTLRPAHRRLVARLWSQVMRDVHGIRFTPGETSAALLEMALVYGSMTDPRSPLSLALRAGGVLDRRGLVRSQIYPERPHPTAELLLCRRAPWRYPSRPAEERTETFAEIRERAVRETLTCLTAIERPACCDGDAETAAAVIGDRNMITGVPCGDPQPLEAFAPDLPLLWGDA